MTNGVEADKEYPDFWNGKHPLAEKAEELYNKLVPAVGKADSVVGELLRASSRIGYDWYNNGWGCNNWSGAVSFISKNVRDHLELTNDEFLKLEHELNYVYEYSHGEPAPHNEDRANVAVTTIHELVVQGILNTSPVDWMPNDGDMFDLQEEDYRGSYDDEDEEY